MLPTGQREAREAVAIAVQVTALVAPDQGRMGGRHQHKILSSRIEAGLERIGPRKKLEVAVDLVAKVVRGSTKARGGALGRFLVPADGVAVTGIVPVAANGAANISLLRLQKMRVKGSCSRNLQRSNH